jgi:hypothetical protein
MKDALFRLAVERFEARLIAEAGFVRVVYRVRREECHADLSWVRPDQPGAQGKHQHSPGR